MKIFVFKMRQQESNACVYLIKQFNIKDTLSKSFKQFQFLISFPHLSHRIKM